MIVKTSTNGTFAALLIILAAIGNFSPSRDIWRGVTTAVVAARLLVAARHRVTVSAASWQLGYVRGLVTAASLLHAAELAALLLLSLADSRRRALAQLHKAAFGVFLGTSTGYFLVQIYLYRWAATHAALGRLYWPHEP